MYIVYTAEYPVQIFGNIGIRCALGEKTTVRIPTGAIPRGITVISDP